MKNAYINLLKDNFFKTELTDEMFFKMDIAHGILERTMIQLGIMTQDEILDCHEALC